MDGEDDEPYTIVLLPSTTIDTSDDDDENGV